MSTYSSKSIKVAIIEDNRFIRDGLKIILSAEKDIELVGSFPSCEDAFYHDDLKSADVVIMDINLPGISGIDGVKYLKKKLPLVEVIIYTAYEDDENVFNAIAAGAVGFLSKKVSPAEMIKALRLVSNGCSPMIPNVAVKIISFFKKQELKQVDSVLTEIEKKVLEKISIGKSYTAVAKELSITEEEVFLVIRTVYIKLQSKLVQLKS